MTSQRRLTRIAQSPAAISTAAQPIENTVCGMTIASSRDATGVLPLIFVSRNSGSPHSEPIQKPKLTSRIAVREAESAMRS